MKILILITTLMISNAFAESIDFMQAQKQVLEHDLIKSTQFQAKAMDDAASVAGAWGDPMVSVGAANLPIDDGLRRDKTPMSGIVFGVAQKIPLGSRISKKEDAAKQRAKQFYYQSEFTSQKLLANFWSYLISLKRHSLDLDFLKENEAWLRSMVQVSKKLYSNGKITQQALLDIQIRHQQVQSNIAEKTGVIETINSNIAYILGKDQPVSIKGTPWNKIKSVKIHDDPKEKSFKAAVSAAELEQSSARWARLPDATVGVNYTKRSNIDGRGDFVGINISMPLPFGSTRSGQESIAANEWVAAKSNLKNYEQSKSATLYSLGTEAKSLDQQLALTKKSLSFARTAKEVSSKSYRIGGVSYFDLLQSELRLQEIELRANELEAKLSENYIQQKLWNSDMVIQ
ncbi:MAG: hypothetical protein COW01_14610 [Bdellovibrionales bacterium CG12_big_fil_rev_8_21_14_0_65_38_15]|nr:MAG: hypothetical protein COW01_14610 [Bdellovibrionales bacterium CG12_big_fil_rev_8_21_14_0_65_38_15]